MSATGRRRGNGHWRVLVVDDHPVARAGLRRLIDEEDELEVCDEAAGVAEALARLEVSDPDLVVADLHLEDGSGLDLIAEIRRRAPSVSTLMWSMEDELLVADRARESGAVGFVSKAVSGASVVAAVRGALEGDNSFQVISSSDC